MLKNSLEVQIYVAGMTEAKAGHGSRYGDYEGHFRLAYQAGYVDGLSSKIEQHLKAAKKRIGYDNPGT